MADTSLRAKRGLVLGAAILAWVIGLLWVLSYKGVITTNRPSAPIDQPTAGEDEPSEPMPEDPVSEIVIESEAEDEAAGRGRSADNALAEATTGSEELEDEGPPTYPVWFESERGLGVCKISWEGGSKTANLHVSARLPEGKLGFSYRCGKHRGRGSINVKPKRVNGVLFCRKDGGVTVKTVRSKDSRCGR